VLPRRVAVGPKQINDFKLFKGQGVSQLKLLDLEDAVDLEALLRGVAPPDASIRGEKRPGLPLGGTL